MEDNYRLEKALEFATKKHKGQFRIGGEEYITHPIAVCQIVKNMGYDTNYQITALFHDLLEDTDATEEEILKFGNNEILQAVKLLTKVKPYNMKDYTENIKKNNMAYIVKGADRLHNLRSAICADDNFKRRYILETYNWYMDFSKEIPKALKELEKSLEKM
ncbi:MAG: HD domain-containing protein [Lachnospirales bacterium]